MISLKKSKNVINTKIKKNQYNNNNRKNPKEHKTFTFNK